ncbi:MAG TPA: hypothetical protein VH309_05405 [Elusimicrobiota bacterium]|jgi:hypothetical protein|nr:hypothetical protein [Elusimicrobiota bacterium]
MRASRLLLLLPLAAAALASGCVQLSFGRKVGEDELILRDQIRSYYDEVGAAFAAGNPEMLANLYDAGIARPMTQQEIREWAKAFFDKHGPARFKLLSIDYDRVGHVSAQVTISYRVDTRDGQGSFQGTERDDLVSRTGPSWYVTGWTKLDPAKGG